METNYLPGEQKYEDQERKLAGCSSYAKTDDDATSMRMKENRGAEKPWSKPTNIVQMGRENQFVVGFSYLESTPSVFFRQQASAVHFFRDYQVKVVQDGWCNIQDVRVCFQIERHIG